jgi:hypothetical protein
MPQLAVKERNDFVRRIEHAKQLIRTDLTAPNPHRSSPVSPTSSACGW